MAPTEIKCGLRHMPIPLGLSVCVAVALGAPALADGPRVDLSPLHVVGGAGTDVATVLELDIEAYDKLKRVKSLTLLAFALDRETYVDLELREINVLSPDGRIVVGTAAGDVPLPRPDVLLFGGTVVGAVDSTVFLSLSPSGSNGFVAIDDQIHVISSGPAGERETAIYEMSALPDGAIDWYAWTCHTDEIVQPPRLGDGRDGGGTLTGGPPRLAEIAIETDWEFTNSLFGGNTANSSKYVLTLIGAVSEIYQRDFNVRFEITYLRLWADSNDPWDRGNTGDQLVQFRNYWEANMDEIPRDDAHFLSGRGLGGGVAYLPGVCNDGWHYALSANLSGFFPYPLVHNHPQNWDPFVVAHEFGHNFGAPHTHDMNPPVDRCASGDCIDYGTIMSYCHGCSGGMTNIRLEFHQRNIDEHILPYLQGTSCLADRPDPIDIPFVDNFETTTLDPTRWLWHRGARINERGNNEPSPPYSVDLDTNAPGDEYNDRLRSNLIRLADKSDVVFQYWAQTRAGAEAGEEMIVEFLKDDRTWKELNRITYDGVFQPDFTFYAHQLPFHAYHDEFRVRFRLEVNERNDDFHIDNVRINDDPILSIAIRSNDAVTLVPIAVSPAGLFGNADGVTDFNRRFVEGTRVTFVAPAEHQGLAFREWQLAGERQTADPAFTFTVTTDLESGVIARAVYGIACDPCDMDCNGQINAFDIDPFLELLFGGGEPCGPCTGDANGDGNVDAFDIEPFLTCLFGP